MSRPHSPSRSEEITTTNATTASTTATTATTSALNPAILPTTSYGSVPIAASSSVLSYGSSFQTHQPYTSTILGPPLLAVSQQSQPSLSLSTEYEASSARLARRAKAHVASACVNCKRAHLSCDIQRPCRRCVDSGKEDTCYDVQHKKRGRPRLREETEAGPSSTPQQPSLADSPQAIVRPIASTRSRRADSYRSHQSRGSESSTYTPMTPQAPSFVYQSALYPGSTSFPSYEVPTAFLDLDLVILRANRSFQHAVASLRDLTNTRLTDIVAPFDGTSLTDVRNRLRGEREQREPSFLPPIVQTGQDPLANIQDTDVDQLTQGYADTTYSWRALTGGPETPTLSARVRLAKITTYIIVVTLPAQRASMPQYQPLTYDQALPQPPDMLRYAAVAPSQPPMFSAPPQYGYQLAEPFQPQRYDLRPTELQQRTGPVMHPYTRGTQAPGSQESLPFPPFISPSQQPQRPPQMQQIGYRPPDMPSGPATEQPEGQSAAYMSASEEIADDGRPQSSKRQRRMGIDEVLQKPD